MTDWTFCEIETENKNFTILRIGENSQRYAEYKIKWYAVYTAMPILKTIAARFAGVEETEAFQNILSRVIECNEFRANIDSKDYQKKVAKAVIYLTEVSTETKDVTCNMGSCAFNVEKTVVEYDYIVNNYPTYPSSKEEASKLFLLVFPDGSTQWQSNATKIN